MNRIVSRSPNKLRLFQKTEIFSRFLKENLAGKFLTEYKTVQSNVKSPQEKHGDACLNC